ncbi:hypothetical protein Slin14017_G094420 [Septoria linicola]|nr:hypothetical protein Slin14017_G094420 [Septoria linicola]
MFRPELLKSSDRAGEQDVSKALDRAKIPRNNSITPPPPSAAFLFRSTSDLHHIPGLRDNREALPPPYDHFNEQHGPLPPPHTAGK